MFRGLLVMAWFSPHIYAASLYTESFSTGTGGWQDRDEGKMVVTHAPGGGNPGGCLRGAFPAIGMPTFDATDAFVATGHLASVAFIGDYVDAEAWLLGFDFMAEHIIPSEFSIRIRDESNTVLQIVTGAITATGVWHSFRLSLLDPNLGGWVGDTSLFGAILTHVSQVEFRLQRSGEGEQNYYIDNIFLDRLPVAMHVGNARASWDYLRPGEEYRIETATNLVESPTIWSVLDTFVATNSMYEAIIPMNGEAGSFRLVGPR